jgi:hypothetical protein
LCRLGRAFFLFGVVVVLGFLLSLCFFRLIDLVSGGFS